MNKISNITKNLFECKCCGKKEMEIYTHMGYRRQLRYCWKCYQNAFISHKSSSIPPIGPQKCFEKICPPAWSLVWDCFFDELVKEYKDKDVKKKIHLSKNGTQLKRSCFKKELGDTTHCVYIKGYKEKETEITYPIVAGLSKNPSSEINFSLNVNTAARYLLVKNELYWSREEIIIIPCCDRKEARCIERNIQMKYRLFS